MKFPISFAIRPAFCTVPGSPRRILMPALLLMLMSLPIFAQKVTAPIAFPFVERQLVGISRANSTAGEAYGACIGTVVSKTKILTSAHCVTVRASSQIADSVTIKFLPLGMGLQTISKHQIRIHPNYVPANDKNEIHSLEAFDIAVIELSSPISGEYFPIEDTRMPLLTALTKIESCGAAVYRNLTIAGRGGATWTPVFSPVQTLVSTGWIARILTGPQVQDHDRIGATSAVDIFSGDSGSPIVCRDNRGVFTLVGLLRGGGGARNAKTVVLQDLFFDKWLVAQLAQ